jgi:hypothetical protein
MSPQPEDVLSLEDAWATRVIQNHPRLADVFHSSSLRDVGENPVQPAERPVLDVVREFQLARRMGQVRAVDDARLFEAIIYSVARLVFQLDENRAFATLKSLQRRAASIQEYPVAMMFPVGIDEAISAEKVSPARDEIERQLKALDTDERTSEYACVARLARPSPQRAGPTGAPSRTCRHTTALHPLARVGRHLRPRVRWVP